MPELREVFEMTTKQIEPDVDAWRQQEDRQRKANRKKKIGAFAVAAAIGVAAVVVILMNRGGQNALRPADQPTVAPVLSTAEKVATGFVEAYGFFNADRAISYLADDADLSQLGLEGTREFRLLLSLLEAQGYKQMPTPCEETGSSALGTYVRCTFDFHLIRSDEIGRGPYGGSYFELTVRDGEIVQASLYLDIGEFGPQMWDPFANWVSTNYPEDGAVMYNSTYTDYRLSEESIRLWEQRTREWVNTIGRLSRIVDGVPFSFRVPTNGWEQKGNISINKSTFGSQGAEAIIFWTSFPNGAGADPCAPVLKPPIGPTTAANLAAAVSTAQGTELVAGPSDVPVGGYTAKHVVLTIREDLGCDPGYFYTWQAGIEGANWIRTGVGDTIRVWIVDVGGTLLFIEAETTTQADSGLKREIQQIVESIRFE